MIKKYFWQILVIVLVFIIFVQRSYNADKIKDDIIIVPEKKGSFEFKNPTYIKVPEFNYTQLDGTTVIVENPINIELAEKYQRETDSLKRKLMYYDAIQMHKYSDTLKDKNIQIDYFAETTGTLDNIKINYKIFSDTLKIKQPVFSLLGGLSLQSNTLTLKTYPGLNIGFQNKKKDIFLLGVNTNQDVEVKYIKNIFTIKK